MDDQVFHGFSGSGCEIGYMHLPGGEFQDMGASSILVKKTAEYKNLNPDSIDGRYVFEHAKQGDADCIRAIDEMVDVLGWVLQISVMLSTLRLWFWVAESWPRRNICMTG